MPTLPEHPLVNRRVRFSGYLRSRVTSLEGTIKMVFGSHALLVDWDDRHIPNLVSVNRAILIPKSAKPLKSEQLKS